MPPKGNIPDRWIPYKACGEVIEGTRFICFKVPVHKRIQENVPGLKRIWDVSAVLAKISNLGAVIDLTNTARYYNPKEFEAANVLHKKILMPGREIPPENKVKEFMDAVDEFLGKDCCALVGVHCTHGLNRTGYMVCRYMKDRMNISAQEAIKRFEKARGYKIERPIYLAGLLGKKLPPPDFGKATVIKPIAKQKYMSDIESPEEDYDTFVNDRKRRHYDNSNRFRSGGFNFDRHLSDRNTRNSSNGYLSWRQRDESITYDAQSSRGRSDSHRSDRSSSERTEYSYVYDY